MKKPILILSLLTFLSVSATLAQENKKLFTGTVTYSIAYPGNNTGPLAASLPKSLSMQVAGNKARTEITLPNGTHTFIINGDEQSVIHMVETTEGKYFSKKTKEDFKQLPQVITLELKETKSLAGIKCKSAMLTQQEKSGKSTETKVFYSSELGSNRIFFNTVARNLEGIPLEFEYGIMNVPMQLSATAVTPGRISNKIFAMPSGFTEVDEAKLRELTRLNRTKN